MKSKLITNGSSAFLKFPVIALVLAVAGFALLTAGCGPKQEKLSSADSKAFASAPAEVKSIWEKAIAADQANDYLTCNQLLESLQQMTLDDAQKQALQKEINVFSARLWQAAEKNDPNATKAIQEINKNKNVRRG